MVDILEWPSFHLVPGNCAVNPVPFTRSGGRALGGQRPATRTDRGWWNVVLENITIRNQDQRRTWNAIRTMLSGSAGLIAVPAWSFDSAPYVDGGDHRGRPILTPHSDDASFGDGAHYQQRRIVVRMAEDAPIGATQCKLEIVEAEQNLVGVRFSYDHALYETGHAIEAEGDFWTVRLSTHVRATIPAGAELEFDMPTCLCRLAEDRGMDLRLGSAKIDTVSVAFEEATDYWSNKAAGLI